MCTIPYFKKQKNPAAALGVGSGFAMRSAYLCVPLSWGGGIQFHGVRGFAAPPFIFDKHVTHQTISNDEGVKIVGMVPT